MWDYAGSLHSEPLVVVVQIEGLIGLELLREHELDECVCHARARLGWLGSARLGSAQAGSLGGTEAAGR